MPLSIGTTASKERLKDIIYETDYVAMPLLVGTTAREKVIEKSGFVARRNALISRDNCKSN